MNKFKKYLLFFLSFTLTLTPLLSPISALAAYNQTNAQSYLVAHANIPWSTMALSALGANSIPSDYLKTVSGTSAIDFESPILAITSLNQDPRTFGSTDLVAKLESFHTAGQIGDATTLNDDIFGILALVSAGQPLTDSAITDTKNFLLTHQNIDGGWSFSVSGSSDSNTTASAIVALIAAGVNSSDSHIVNALNYLKTAQNSDGGFTYDPKSQYGTASDSSSTAWALWALNAVGIDQSTWSKGNNSPVSYLSSNQGANGYFAYQNGSPEDSFSAPTTAYAVIAILGKTLPIHTITLSQPSFSFRIEGSQDTICTGKAQGPNAMDIIKNASVQCGFTYNIKTASFGSYLNQINEDTAAGNSGWLYLVNNISPDIGADTYALKTGDEVLWYFGDFGWQPTRLSLDKTQVATGQSAQATVESFNNGQWSALNGATVSTGANTATTDASGHANATSQDGFYKVVAQKTGFIRSNSVLLQIGNPGSSNVSLSATIIAGEVQGTSTQVNGISFNVNPEALDFGNLASGASSTKKITINNTGNSNLQIQSIVSGDNLFVDNLSINSLAWQAFKLNLTASQSQDENITLTVPQNFNGGTGQKSGQIIFWASAN